MSLFENCISADEMEEVLGTERITILFQYFCYCYSDCPRQSHAFDIFGVEIKVKHVVEHMNLIKYNPQCNHVFLETFSRIGAGLYEPFFGS
jgi:hypothetical protein